MSIRCNRSLLLVALLSACSFDEPGDVSAYQISIVSGDGQSGTAGAMLQQPLIVGIVDPEGQPVEDYTIDFLVTTGAGSLSAEAVRTDALGQARTHLTLDRTAGTNGVSVDVPDAVGGPLAFTATGLAGAAMMLDLTNDDQSGTVAAPLAHPLVATVVDVNHNPVPGVSVQFDVADNNGSLSAISGTSDARGQVATILTLGTAAGLNKVSASGVGLTGADFRATGVADVPNAISAMTTSTPTATAGSAIATPFTALVVDRFENPVAGASVTFAVTGGGGSMSPQVATTDATGHASSTLTTGTTVGANTVAATVTGVATAATFGATGTVGAPAKVVVVSGDTQIGVLGMPLTAPLVVRVEDANHNPVPNINVSWSVAQGGGSVTSSQPSTAAGLVQTTLTLGPSGGEHVVEARATGATMETFTATAASLSSVENLVIYNSMRISDTAVADFNGDQRPDIAALTAGNAFTLWLNNTSALATTPTWRTPVAFPLNGTNGARALAVADFNQDGKPDLAMITIGIYPSVPGYVAVYLNTTAVNGTTPTFATPLPITETYIRDTVAAADLNADGKPDLVFAEPGTGSVLVAMNTTPAGATTASFASVVWISVTNTIVSYSGGYHYLALADFNADTRPDLAVLTVSGVNVLLNTTTANSSTPTFGTSVPFTTGSNLREIRIADVTGDGNPDLLVGRDVALEVRANTTAALATAPSFGSASVYNVAANTLTAGDFNGDGRMDIATTSTTSSVTVLLNTGSGFIKAAFTAKASGPVAALDLNADGWLDLVYSDFEYLYSRLAN